MCHAHYHICTHSLFLSHFRQTMPPCIPCIQNANLADDTLLFAKTEAARWWLWTENLKRNQINKLKAWTRKKTKTPAHLWRESLSLYSGKKIRYFSGKSIKDSNALLRGSICAAPFFFCVSLCESFLLLLLEMYNCGKRQHLNESSNDEQWNIFNNTTNKNTIVPTSRPHYLFLCCFVCSVSQFSTNPWWKLDENYVESEVVVDNAFICINSI